ncbi:MAG: hypothetical protein CME07_06055 [Gemmatimonadetes bacterium]|nr:hypothetical protein [Gemmatimonadota bacterium]
MRIVRPTGSLSGGSADTLAHTLSTVHVERDIRYYLRPPDFGPGQGGFESEFYYWNDHKTSISLEEGAPGLIIEQDFTAPDPVPGGVATLTARVVSGGYPIDDGFTNSIRFEINGTTVGSRLFYNWSLYPSGSGFIGVPDSMLSTHPIPAGSLAGDGTDRFLLEGITYSGDDTSTRYSQSRFFFDWFEITWERSLLARNGHLAVDTGSGPSSNVYAGVSDFGGSDLSLYDITDPSDPARVGVDEAVQIVSEGGGRYGLHFDHDNATGLAVYLAVRESLVSEVAPAEVERVPPTGILAAGAGAGYVVVAHEDFLTEASELAGLRAAQYGSVLAPVSEVYDLFSNGHRTPEAIKSYAAYAFHRWGSPLAFLCLFGDASEDHRAVGGRSDPDFIPSHSLWAQYEGAPEESDQYYAELTRTAPGAAFDDLPDIFVGRLAVGTADEAAWNVERIAAYEALDSAGDWTERGVFLADDQFSGSLGGGASGYVFRTSESGFRETSEELAVALETHPFSPMFSERVYVGEWTHPCADDCYKEYSQECESEGDDCGIWYDCRNSEDPNGEYYCMRTETRQAVHPDLRSKLNRGALFWNYQGHANKYWLAHEEVFKDFPIGGIHDVESLSNEGMPFVFFGFACHLAEFDRSDEGDFGDCVAEKLMNVRPLSAAAPGGAIGVFASSGYEFLGPNLVFNEDLFTAFFHPGSTGVGGDLPDVGQTGVFAWTLGEAATRARLLFQMRYASPGQTRQAAQRFVLLGDPAVTPRVGEPEYTVTVNGNAVSDGSYLDVTEQGQTIAIRVEVTDAHGIRDFRIVDTILGAVPESEFEVTPSDTTAGGVARSITVDYEMVPRPEDYDVLLQADNGTGWSSSFTLSIRLEVAVEDLVVYPNPFSQEASLYYRLAAGADDVRVRVYTLAGREVWESDSAPAAADMNHVVWNGRDSNGTPVANGTYIVHVKARGVGGDSKAVARAVKIR